MTWTTLKYLACLSSIPFTPLLFLVWSGISHCINCLLEVVDFGVINTCIRGVVGAVGKLSYSYALPGCLAASLYTAAWSVFDATHQAYDWLWVISFFSTLVTIVMGASTTLRLLFPDGLCRTGTLQRMGCDLYRNRKTSPITLMSFYILALPSFYGLMSFLSVHVWFQFFTGQLDAWTDMKTCPFDESGPHNHEEFSNDISDLFSALPDFYDVVSLVFFLNLMWCAVEVGASRLGQTINNGSHKLLGDCVKFLAWVYTFMCFIQVVGVIMNGLQKHFCLPYLIKDHGLADDFVSLILKGKEVTQVGQWFVGSLAIMFIYKVEIMFHDQLVEAQFVQPGGIFSSKFWAIKVFVTVECAGEFFLSVANLAAQSPQPHWRLYYSCFMSVFCCFIAWIQSNAYTSGHWYSVRVAPGVLDSFFGLRLEAAHAPFIDAGCPDRQQGMPSHLADSSQRTAEWTAARAWCTSSSQSGQQPEDSSQRTAAEDKRPEDKRPVELGCPLQSGQQPEEEPHLGSASQQPGGQPQQGMLWQGSQKGGQQPQGRPPPPSRAVREPGLGSSSFTPKKQGEHPQPGSACSPEVATRPAEQQRPQGPPPARLPQGQTILPQHASAR